MKYLLRLVVVILMVGSAYAQSYLRACQGSDTSRWSNCVGTTFADGNNIVKTPVVRATPNVDKSATCPPTGLHLLATAI